MPTIGQILIGLLPIIIFAVGGGIIKVKLTYSESNHLKMWPLVHSRCYATIASVWF